MIGYIYEILLSIALILMYFALKEYSKSANLIRGGVRSTAKVIELIEVSGDDGNTYKPVFEYKRGNSTQIFKSSVSSNPPSYSVGEKVKVVYNPREIDEVKVISYWGLYRATVILLAIAAPFLIIGGGYFLYKLT